MESPHHHTPAFLCDVFNEMGREDYSYLNHDYLTAHICKDFQTLVCVEMHVSLVNIQNSRKNVSVRIP